MSTRGVIARHTAPGQFAGRYHHFDAYPHGLGQALYRLYHEQFADDLPGMLAVLIDQHPAGWSSIMAADTLDPADFSQPAGFPTDRSEPHPGPLCYCHGGRAETGFLITERDATDAEFAYAIDAVTQTMTLLVRVASLDPTTLDDYVSWEWLPIADIALDEPAPDWEDLTTRAYGLARARSDAREELRTRHERAKQPEPTGHIYMSCAETAKLIRRQLKTAFPAVKFSVRSDTYAGGASIDVRWLDGPTTDAVKTVIDQYEGASIDPYQDTKVYRYQLDEQGRAIHYGADFVFCERRYSVPFLRRVAAAVAIDYGECLPKISESEYGAYLDGDWRVERAGGQFLSWLVNRELAQTPA